MIALQEFSYREENRIWLLLARKKITIKKAANNVSVRGSFSPFLISFPFLSVQLFTSPLQLKIPVLNYLYFYFGPYHINTIH